MSKKKFFAQETRQYSNIHIFATTLLLVQLTDKKNQNLCTIGFEISKEISVMRLRLSSL